MSSSSQLFERNILGPTTYPASVSRHAAPGVLSQGSAVSARKAGQRWSGFWESHAHSLCVNGKPAIRPGFINFSDGSLDRTALSLDRTAPSLDWTLHCHIHGATVASCQSEGVLDPTCGCLWGLEQVQFHLLCHLPVLAASVIGAGREHAYPRAPRQQCCWCWGGSGGHRHPRVCSQAGSSPRPGPGQRPKGKHLRIGTSASERSGTLSSLNSISTSRFERGWVFRAAE